MKKSINIIIVFLGAFILCKTSNPTSQELQTQILRDGDSLYEKVAKLSLEWSKALG